MTKSPIHAPGSSAIWRYVVVLALLMPAVLLRANLGLGTSKGPVVISETTLPPSAGDWHGSNVPLTDDELSLLQSPAAAQKVYVNGATGDVVQVLLLQVDNTQNAHDPRICMRGSGYELTSLNEEDATWVGKSERPYRVSRAVFSKEGLNITMFYWVQTPSGTIADMSAGFKWAGVVRALRGLSTKGVAVRVICLPANAQRRIPTAPGVAGRLWRELNESVDIERLVAGM
jgi:EpsI family protein